MKRLRKHYRLLCKDTIKLIPPSLMLHIFLADGFEDIEAIAPIDILRRCRLDVRTVSISDSLNVTSAHGNTLVCNQLISDTDFAESEALLLPGGWPGAKNLLECEALRQPLVEHFHRGALTCAICAAPMVLGENGLLEGRRATCYPGFEEHLHGATLSTELVVEDGNLITGRGPGAAMAFGYAIATRFAGEEFVSRLKEGMIFAY